MSWPSDARRDRLIGDWYLYQRTGGHRTSTDDVITAWHAARAWRPRPARYLDLGCGIGSVLFTVAHRLRPDRSLGVEAQSESVLMARRSLAELPDPPAIAIEAGDFRSFDFGAQPFDLVTGSPPYFPLGTGVPPRDAQRLACRFETRGGVEAYCDVAAQVLTDEGRFHLVFQTEWHERVERAASSAGLHITATCHFRMRADDGRPFLTTYELRREARKRIDEHAAVRARDGGFTPAFLAVRRSLGLESRVG
ncbi:MAG: methyltransferase domain-containing protein [Myxococcota bacterium]